MTVRYAGHPTAVVLEDVAGIRGKTKIDHLLWGDELKDLEQIDGAFRKVEVRVGAGRVKKTGWIKANEVQDDPVLEVTFIDIGQGDGCVVVRFETMYHNGLVERPLGRVATHSWQLAGAPRWRPQHPVGESAARNDRRRAGTDHEEEARAVHDQGSRSARSRRREKLPSRQRRLLIAIPRGGQSNRYGHFQR